MNEFVEQCRREWRRRRVPIHVAEEMAAELAADLQQAQAEGVPPEEVLGRGADDPRSFAAAWARERDVGRSPSPLRRTLLFAAFAAFVALAVSGTALMVFASPSHSVSAAGPTTLEIRPSPAPNPTRFAATATWVPTTPTVIEAGSDDNTRTLGKVLLIVGLAGTAALSLSVLWRRGSSL